MKRLDDLIHSLKSAESEIFQTIRQTLEENKETILDMNSEIQLFEKGINRHGVDISSFAPYSETTIFRKKQKGQPTDRVTLRDEGDFHFSFFIEFSDDGFLIKASDWKSQILVSRYGESILGLTDENFKDLANNYVLPEISKIFKNI